MTGDPDDYDDHGPPDQAPRLRPARPAQISLEDIASAQKRRSRHLKDASPPAKMPVDSTADEPHRSAAATDAGHVPGRFASLRRKLTRSKRTSGFLLDGVSSDRSPPSRPTSRLVNATSTSDPPEDHARATQPGAHSPRIQSSDGPADDAAAVGATNMSTPPSKRQSNASNLASPANSAFGSPPSYRSPRISTDHHHTSRPSHDRSRPASGMVDPTQLVRMALNLSESRRMQLDPGHLPSVMLQNDTRSVSGPIQTNVRPGSGGSPANSPETRSLPRPTSGSNASRNGDAPLQGSSPIASSSNSIIGGTDAQAGYVFSPATLERVNKAKGYIELGVEYRRLLRSLPPLKPCSQSEGKKTTTELGRPYNPLQYARNRRTRVEHNVEPHPEAHGWADAVHVRYWVDSVEKEAQQPGFRSDDVVLLPQWSSGISRSTNPESEEAKGRQQATENGKKESRGRRFDWRIAPAELLEDAYWLEQDHHKSLICSKQGSRIFHNFTRPLKAAQERRDRANTGVSSKSPRSPESSLPSPTSPTSQRGFNSTASDQETDDDRTDIPHHMHSTARIRRNPFKKRAKADSLSTDEGSGDERQRKDKRSKRSKPRPSANIGPLEKHMQEIIRQETRNERTAAELSPTTPPSAIDSPEGRRRHGISGESFKRPSYEEDGETSASFESRRWPDDPRSAPTSAVPRISVETYDEERLARADIHENGFSKAPVAVEKPTSSGQGKNRPSRLGFWSRPKSKADNRIEVTDFAKNPNGSATWTSQYGSEADSGVDSRLTKPMTADSRRSVESEFDNDAYDSGSANGKLTSPAARHFFKGGRIGELVRNEGSQASNFIFKRQAPRQPSPEKPRKMDAVMSDPEDANTRKPRPRPAREEHSSSSGRRGSSASGSRKADSPQYHIKNLPTFQATTRSRSNSRSPSKERNPKQQDDKRIQRLHSRLGSLAPSSIDTSNFGTPVSELSRTTTENRVGRDDRRESYGFPRASSDWAGSPAGVRAADKRLSAVMSAEDDAAGKEGPPMSPPFASAKSTLATSPPVGHGWSIEKVRDPVKKPTSRAVAASRRDVAQIRSLLLSAGVKAHTIAQRAEQPRDDVTDFLRGAFAAAGQDPATLGRMSARQAHVLAAQLLSERLARTLGGWDGAVARFRGETCAALAEQVDDLRERATAALMPRVRGVGDEADAFVARLTTTHTLAIRQVMDGVDAMLRKRRRRLRYAQRQLFTLLEWALVALMWGIWLVVFVLRLVRGAFVGSARAVRWLLWL